MRVRRSFLIPVLAIGFVLCLAVALHFYWPQRVVKEIISSARAWRNAADIAHEVGWTKRTPPGLEQDDVRAWEIIYSNCDKIAAENMIGMAVASGIPFAGPPMKKEDAEKFAVEMRQERSSLIAQIQEQLAILERNPKNAERLARFRKEFETALAGEASK